MAITLQTINDNPHIYEVVIIGSAGGDTQTLSVSSLDDAVAIDGVNKQRLNVNLEYSLDPACSLVIEYATNISGSFSGIETGLSMDISGSAPNTTVDSTAEGVSQSSSSGIGTSATFNITSSGGVITSITSVDEGDNYADGDTITFTAGDLTALGTLGTVTGNLVLNVITGSEQFTAYGTGSVFIKNTIGGSNGDIKVTFLNGPGCCKISAAKTEGFRLVSPYYRKVSNRRA